MSHSCVRCSAEFEVSWDEAQFLEQVSPTFGGQKVPIAHPTHCPSCRLQRRMAHRNQIYVNLAKIPGYVKPMFSMYFGQSKFPIVSNQDWWDEKNWSPEELGRPFDFNRTFFEQFAELREAIPRPAINMTLNENSDYCNNAGALKNCYFVFDANTCEECFYLETATGNRDCLDCSLIYNSELCFDCVGVSKCYNLQSSDHCVSCSDSYFLLNCRSCKHCFGCVNLVQSEYCVFNKQLSCSEYQDFLASQQLASYIGRKKVLDQIDKFRSTFPRPHLYGSRCEDVSGNHIHSSRQIHESFFIGDAERLSYCFACGQNVSDCQDLTIWGQNAELLYECLICGSNVFRLLFCYNCWNGASDLCYCDSCHGSSHLFGCVGLRKRSHYILNKAYSIEEYEALALKVVEHMKRTGEWGEFFPAHLSHVPYNLSLAQRYFPMDKQKAEAEGYQWLEPYEREGQVPTGAIKAASLPDLLLETERSFIALSELSGRPFKITAEEIRRLHKFKAPLPHRAYDERMNDRMARAGSILLFERSCAKSRKPLRTAHPPDAPYPVWDREVFELAFSK